jgi:hypothetical protein
MSDLLDKFVKDLHMHCKNIDNFNQEVLTKIDDKNKEFIQFCVNIFNANNKKDKDKDKDKKRKQSDGGFFNPFDE